MQFDVSTEDRNSKLATGPHSATAFRGFPFLTFERVGKMKGRRGILSALVLLTLAGAAYADSVSWISGSTSPKEWSIDPARPAPTDVITFTGPTAKVYSNSCLGEATLGGTPQISVDTKTKTVVLWFKGPVPQVCTMLYSPVAGLQGEFGPLPAGDWTFTCLSRDLGFSVPFTVQEKFAYHVDADAPGTVHDGRTWATALLTLQDALAVASSGDEIVVAEGTYKPDQGGTATAGRREESFLLKAGVKIRGGFAGYGQPNPEERDVAKHPTILSGDLKGNDRGAANHSDNSYHVIVGPPDGAVTTLDGFTVTGGNADANYPHHYGGGLYNPEGKMQVVRCTFWGNIAAQGAAVMNFGPALTLVNCELMGNHALMLGGGLYNYEGAATLVNCRIVGNEADYAEVAGGTAIYNQNGALTVLDCTIADNRAPIGRAIANFTWSATSAIKVKVANSILSNGGEEVWSNVRGLVDITYSDVQGGSAGTGNISLAPQFVRSGRWDFDGSWLDGDYRLQSTSPALDAGNNAALPADSLDLDADGNVTEPLSFDLDNTERVQNAKVDMGAYEQVKKAPPAPSVTMIVAVGDGFLTLAPDPSAPSGSNTFIGSVDVDIELNFRGKLSVTASSTSAAGGKWSASLAPDTVGPGKAVVTVTVKGENLNVAALTPGTTVQVAETEFWVEPVQ